MSTPAQSNLPILSIDLGGSKIIAALISNGQIIDRIFCPTERTAGAQAWIDQLLEISAGWAGRYNGVGIAVTGRVHDGFWSAVNPATLDIPDQYPLVPKLEAALDHRVFAINDAQAAAWGEYRHGTSMGQDMVFLTVSTGIGGGVVSNGRLVSGRNGIAGHFGHIRHIPDDGHGPFEDGVSGRWISNEAKRFGHTADARAVFEAADAGSSWAKPIVANSARQIGELCQNIQLMFDPHCIVIGGGIGLAAGYLDLIEEHCSDVSNIRQPTFRRALLGSDAGVFGVADLAATTLELQTGRKK